MGTLSAKLTLKEGYGFGSLIVFLFHHPTLTKIDEISVILNCDLIVFTFLTAPYSNFSFENTDVLYIILKLMN